MKSKQDTPIMKDRYVNFFTDFGFKRLFGSEPTKNCLIDFLNALLEGEEEPIVDLQFKKSEHLGANEIDRKAIFDVYCETASGERIIVELQKAKQKFFKDRSIFYSTFPIQEQAEKGEWDYRLNAVYTIGILDFEFDEDRSVNNEREAEGEPRQYLYNVKLTDQETKKVYYDKLTFIYLEMPNFNKTLDQLETKFDKWMFAIKNLSRLDDKPAEFRDAVFEAFFRAAEIAAFSEDERDSYRASLKTYRDWYSVLETAKEEGYEKGREKGMQEATQVIRMTEEKLQEAQKREEEAQKQKEELANTAVEALVAAGIPREQARKQLGLD